MAADSALTRHCAAVLVSQIALMALVGCNRHAQQPQASESQAPAALPLSRSAAATAAEVLGHTATVRCLRGERALTEGNELRCEDWAYVQANYR